MRPAKFTRGFTDTSQLPLMLRTEDIAQVFSCTVDHARRLCREGTFNGAVNISGQWLVPKRDLIKQFNL